MILYLYPCCRRFYLAFAFVLTFQRRRHGISDVINWQHHLLVWDKLILYHSCNLKFLVRGTCSFLWDWFFIELNLIFCHNFLILAFILLRVGILFLLSSFNLLIDLIGELKYKIVIVAELLLIVGAEQLVMLGFDRVIYYFSSYYHDKYQLF